MTDLEARLDRMESIEAIKKLKHQYCAYCDDSYDPEGIASLFVEDGVWDGGAHFGRHEGHAAIKAHFSAVSSRIVFSAHLVLNERITVEGDRARAAWWIIMPATIVGEGGKRAASWLLGEYDDRYVRRGGTWLFERLTIDTHFVAPHAGGWAEV